MAGQLSREGGVRALSFLHALTARFPGHAVALMLDQSGERLVVQFCDKDTSAHNRFESYTLDEHDLTRAEDDVVSEIASMRTARLAGT